MRVETKDKGVEENEKVALNLPAPFSRRLLLSSGKRITCHRGFYPFYGRQCPLMSISTLGVRALPPPIVPVILPLVMGGGGEGGQWEGEQVGGEGHPLRR